MTWATVSREGLLLLENRSASEQKDEPDPVKAETIGAMADSIRGQLAADYGLALGPFAESVEDRRVHGHFHYALATRDGIVTRSSLQVGHPSIWKPRAAKSALNLLRLTLLESVAAT
jgi:nicotinamide-nucleotide amidase